MIVVGLRVNSGSLRVAKSSSEDPGPTRYTIRVPHYVYSLRATVGILLQCVPGPAPDYGTVRIRLPLTPDAVVARLATEPALQLAPLFVAAAWLLMLDSAAAALLLS